MADQATILDQEIAEQRVNRRKLLPWWIKMFCWIFMAFGGIAILGYCTAVIFGLAYPVEFYGLQANTPISLMGLFLTSLFVLKGVAGFGLWFEKDWAIQLAFVDGIVGILVCVVVMIVLPAITGVGNSFRIELIFLAFYLGKMTRIKPMWK
jgi:hypothetical protein